MATIRQLQINLTARIERLEQELDKARREIRRTVQSMGRIATGARQTERQVISSFARMRTATRNFASSLNVVKTAFVAVAAATTAFLAGSFIQRITANGDADLRPGIFQLAKKRDWVLWELREESARMEDVFHTLTAERPDENGSS